MNRSGRTVRSFVNSFWLGVLPVLFYCSVGLARTDNVVNTQDGAVRGFDELSMHAFLGIPYAEPPVGDLRWRAPRPAHHWHGVRDATHFAPHCAQNPSPFGEASQSEDCLYLNVYTPDHHADADHEWRDHDKRPVMVWIHGGALVTGESDDYGPESLVSKGVIVVTINYRLGALGFLVHPALAQESDANGPKINYGLRDQQAALQWVQDNIEAFGGDRHNVTVFGESAGGLSTLSQIVSPKAAGLFHKAIVESGAYSLALPSIATSEAAGTAYATSVGCADQSAECLRSVPVATILANESAGGYVPTVDGTVLPSSIGPALAAGTFNRVPVLQGSNHDEWRLFVALDFDLLGNPLTDATYTSLIDATFGPAVGPQVLAQYPAASYASPDLAYAAAGTDTVFACTARIAERDLAQYVKLFSYEFSDPNAPQDFLPPVSFPYQAAHASEIQYIFTLKTTVPRSPLTAAQQQLSDTMVDYWSRFAKDSDPNQKGTPFWPQYHLATDDHQNLTPGGVMPEFDFAKFHKCDFWNPILKASGD